MIKKIYSIKNITEYTFFRLFVAFFKLLPKPLVLFILKIIVVLGGYYLGIRKKIVLSQLKMCFPDKSKTEILRLTKRIYIELAVTIAEVFVFSDEYLFRKLNIVNLENITEALKFKKGVIVVSAHFSNWELGAKVLANKYPPVYGVVKKQRNRLFDNYINLQRQNTGLVTIDMNNALKHIIGALNKNQIVAFLVDQYARKQGVEMDFLGHKTKSYTSVAQIAIKYGVPVVMAFDLRDSNGEHKLIFHEPMIFDNLSYNDKNVLDISKKIYQHIEEYIIDYPHLWFWVHRKWR